MGGNTVIFGIKKREILPETLQVLVLQICDGGPSHFGVEPGKISSTNYSQLGIPDIEEKLGDGKLGRGRTFLWTWGCKPGGKTAIC